MTSEDGVSSGFDALYSVTQRLMDADAEREICEVAVTAVPEIFGVAFAGLWLYDADATELQQTAETERSGRLLGTDVVYRPGNSVSWEAFEAGELRRIPRDAGDGSKYNADSRIGSELVLPLGDHGVLNIASEEPDAFSDGDVRVARMLSANVESALSRAQREHALEVQRDRLEEFVSMVSHDLRNPLTVADGHLELARQTGETDHLDELGDALDRMETLIEDLLTLAEQGYVVDERTRIDLQRIAEEAWSNVPTADGTLRTEGTAAIFGDESRLLQVFENLFRNSIEHGSASPASRTRRDTVEHGSTGNRDATRSDDAVGHGSTDSQPGEGDDGTGGVIITVGPLESLHTTTRVSTAEFGDGFYVADDGPGLSDDDPAAVFETGHSTDGTGLGLAIVQRIVQAHGWEITAGESPSGGARFEVTGRVRPVTPFETDSE